MMKKKILILISAFALVSSVVFSESKLKGSAELKSTGDIAIEIPQAHISMNYMKRINIWHIRIKTPIKDYRKNGIEGSAHLFFSRRFTLKTGKYPVAFSYLNKKDTMGGTFFYEAKPKKTERFTHNTTGEINFTKIGDLLEGDFSFTVYSDKENSRSVKVSGKFSLPVKKGFPGVSPKNK